jgi:lipoate-protein ligase A
MTVFHALARVGIEGLILVEPDHHFVCLGYFDDAEATVDFELCAKENLPVMRREIGGGVVLLAPGQLFYQLILKKGDPRMPLSVAEAYRKFSCAPIAVYRRLGVDVVYRPVNDLVTAEGGKKISGQGAADIGACFVFVGNILLNFDPWLMSRCIKVPDESFHNRLYQSLEKSLSWVGRELGFMPEMKDVEKIATEEFERIVGPLEEAEIPAEVWEQADRLAHDFTSQDVIFMETPRRHSTIKVKEGTYLRCGVHKAPGGLIWIEVEIGEGKIQQLKVSGDRTLLSEGEFLVLSELLQGVDFDFGQVAEKVTEFFENHCIRRPSIQPQDLACAIVGERGSGEERSGQPMRVVP